MTKKDYVRLADAFLSARNQCSTADQLAGWRHAFEYVSTVLARDNARFDLERFAKASGAAG